MKKPKEHSEAERNWRGKSDEELKLKESHIGSKKYQDDEMKIEKEREKRH